MHALLIVDDPKQRIALAEWLRHSGGFEQVSCIGSADFETLFEKFDGSGAQLLVVARAPSSNRVMTQLERAWYCLPYLPILLLPSTEPADGTAVEAWQTAAQHAVHLASAGRLTGPPHTTTLGDPSLAAVEEADKLDLTLRQYQILVLLSMGHQQKVISRMLGISLATVKSHAAQLYQRLGAGNKAEAIYAARQRGARLAWPNAQDSNPPS